MIGDSAERQFIPHKLYNYTGDKTTNDFTSYRKEAGFFVNCGRVGWEVEFHFIKLFYRACFNIVYTKKFSGTLGSICKFYMLAVVTLHFDREEILSFGFCIY